VNVNPPWPIACPFTMSSRTVIRIVARPGDTSTISMPSPRLARSPVHIASALRAATSCGVIPGSPAEA
jgi:hypothetical protein